MKTLPAAPDLAHLKKQAKSLLRHARDGRPEALLRFVEMLPAARDIAPSALADRRLALHDAQSVVAREYGFPSWTQLARFVEWTRSTTANRLETWLSWVFDGNAGLRSLAIRMQAEEPGLLDGDPWLACVIGDEARIAESISANSAWVHRPGDARAMPPLAAVTHSRLIHDEAFAPGLLASARLLLSEGADPNGTWTDPRFPDSPLSILYGAVGRTHHAGMTRLLLDAGADPNDGESLYHSVESHDLACTRLLLDAGACVTGTNAIARVLDYDRLEGLNLLLARGGDARERPWIHHAILRGRSLDHVRALVTAGADLDAQDDRGISLFRWALLHGRTDVVTLLRENGIEEAVGDEDAFVAACTLGDETAARAILAHVPDLFTRLGSAQLQAMPQLADTGDIEAVRTMLALGWPREVKTAWDATALNLAVMRGDSAMARLLLAHGADWRTPHGHGDIVLGTLSFASRFDDIDNTAPRDYLGCADALVAHGVPMAEFGRYAFSSEVSAYLEDASAAS